jgi:hypothetical protein
MRGANFYAAHHRSMTTSSGEVPSEFTIAFFFRGGRKARSLRTNDRQIALKSGKFA